MRSAAVSVRGSVPSGNTMRCGQDLALADSFSNNDIAVYFFVNLTFAKLHFSCHNAAIKMSKKSVVNFKCAVLLKNKASPKVSTSTMSKRNKNKTSV